MSYVLSRLESKREVDRVIKKTVDKVLVLRFGKEADPVCLQLDDIVSEELYQPNGERERERERER